MMSKFGALLKKDIKLIYKHNFVLIMISSLLVYSLYINYVYVPQSMKTKKPTNIYLLEDNIGSKFSHIEGIHGVKDKEKLLESLENDTEGIGFEFDVDGNPKEVFLYHVSEKTDRSKVLVGLNKLRMEDEKVDIRYLEDANLEEKNRATMTSVIIFFEIAAISFLGIASLFFKEKSMGVVKVYGILPSSNIMYMVSKLILFTFLEVIFVSIMSFLNVGLNYSLRILPILISQVVLLSPIMISLGLMFSLIYKNFKQFIFAYTIIVVLATSPVFLFVTSSLEWSGIKFFPTYYAYSSIYSAMLQQTYPFMNYAVGCILLLVALVLINKKLMQKEIERG